MSSIDKSGTYALGTRTVKRLGYGAMQLAGPGVFGPPKDKQAALDVLREAVAGAGENPAARLDAFLVGSFSPGVLDPDLLSPWVVFWSLIRHSPPGLIPHSSVFSR